MDSTRVATNAEATPSGYRWVMLAGLWFGYACFGLVAFSVAPLVAPMSEDFGLSRAAMGSVLGAWPLFYVAAAIPAGALVDRFGLRRSLATGIFLIGLSGMLRAVAVDYVTLFIAVGIFGLGGPLVSVGAPKLVSTWFRPEERGTAMGIYMTGPSVGSIVTLATANSILMPLFDDSWRLTIAAFASLAFLGGVLWLLLAREPRLPAGAPAQSPSVSSVLKAFPALLRIGSLQIIVLIGFGSFLYSHGFSNWLPEVLRAGGKSASQAGFWAALPTAIGIVAQMTIPRLATPPRRIAILATLFVIGAAGPLLVETGSDGPMLLGLVLLGARVTVIPIALLLLMDIPQVGPHNMGAASGLYFTIGQSGGVLGPLIMGALADASGGFASGLILLAGLSVVLMPLTLGLGMARRRATVAA